jgi:hypothetical protein
MKYNKKKVLETASISAQKWLSGLTFNGKYDINVVYKELQEHFPKSLVLVVKEPSEVVNALIKGAIAINFSDLDNKNLLTSQLRGQLWDQLRDQLWCQLRNQLRDQLGVQLTSQLWDQLWGQLESQLGDQLGDQLWGQLWGQLRNQLGDQLGNQLWDQLGSQLWDQLEGQLWGQLRDQVESQIKELSPCECIWDYYSMAFWDSAFSALPVENRHELFKNNSFSSEAYKHGLGYIIRLGALQIGVLRPEAYRDENLQIHREDGPAIIWGENQRYWWHGTQVPKEWILEKENIDPKLVLTWENIEQRRCLAEIIGWNSVIEQLQPKIIDIDPDPQIGILLEVDLPHSGKEKFIKVVCSTNRTFVLPVPKEMTTALEANAWTYGIDGKDLLDLETRT